MQALQSFLQQFINGIQIGSIYALIAVGYTMVYGVLRFINFAHGDVYMLGAFFGSFMVNLLIGKHAPPVVQGILGLFTAMIACAPFSSSRDTPIAVMSAVILPDRRTGL